MLIRPLFKFDSKILVGLDSDFNSSKVKDGLVVEIDIKDRKIVNPPWSYQKKLKFSGYYETISESERDTITAQIFAMIDIDLQNEIIDLLIYPQKDSIDSLIWVNDRLKGFNELKVYRPNKNRYAEFEIDESNIEKEFERLASVILLNKCLKVNYAQFRFTEIEFYYYSNNHQDAYTHKHDEQEKRWRFHNQGFDITLKGATGFGGILIRGIELECISGIEDPQFFNGPRRVMFKIMSYLNPVDQINNVFGLINSDKQDLKIFQTFRHGINTPDPDLQCDNIDYFQSAKYRFIVNPRFFKKNQFSGAEDIARSFDNKEMAFEFLGYNLGK